MNMLNAKVDNTQLDPRMSLYQGNARIAASSNIKSYGMFANNVADRQLVNDLLFKCNYIYVQKVCIVCTITLMLLNMNRAMSMTNPSHMSIWSLLM